ncbi:HORMA domain-containing protein [Desarmillaria tabescens]|uniref:HORMA domain-containing protein n=1 Tax=Armillaria tabescens TaxID=1929756 RepID=A0AA39NDE3_ARMTA|nr:HORMA domain-containing protein [Desarmillaria tabescens]KAK0463577.1 HORMA domain-containing protein [Desarmillaria tabescens]
MQNQLNKTETQAISSAQSLASVQTLLKAGLGCITFMRDLLPHDNFSESHFVTSEESASQDSSGSFSSLDLQKKRNVNSFKIMTMTRGYTDEADRLLNYLEYGVFDALQKQYLRTFIFAVYLDNKDPNNIIEAYTFNFQYHKLPGTDTTVPVMTLGDDTKRTPLRGFNTRKKDPVAEAVSKGKLPTLRDVKRSVKTLLKTLITSMTQMDVLPKRRFASFKMFYTDDTPSEYEPPHFIAADAEKDKWFFMTHDMDEIPDKWSVGKVDTGHHAVNVSVTSIATYLPSSTEYDNAPFTGTTTRCATAPSLSPIEEASLRMEQAAKQKEDAENRNIVWSTEDVMCEEDADGENEADFVQQPDGTYVLAGMAQQDAKPVPIGLRTEDGCIEPIPAEMMPVDEEIFGGSTQTVPTRLNDMLTKKTTDVVMIDETQPVDDHTPKSGCHSLSRDGSTSIRPRDGLLDFSPTQPCLVSRLTTPSPESPLPGASDNDDIDTQLLQKLVLSANNGDDTEMLDMETQAMDYCHPSESIQSYGISNQSVPEIIDADIATPRQERKVKHDTDVVECECGVSLEDGCCFCEGGCERWYHVWCMGYHSSQDPRLPDKFVCFDCRVRADPTWEMIKMDLFPTMLSKFRELASFRRAIKITEKFEPETAAQFTKQMGCENNLGKQLFKRLEIENFIIEHETVVDDIGFTESRARNGKGKGKAKGKQTKTRRNVQKAKYVFNRQSKHTKEYSDYFDPSLEAESRLLGLPQKKLSAKPRPGMSTSKTQLAPLPPAKILVNDTQTQDDIETQTALPSVSADKLKRTKLDEDSRPRKRVKVSVAPGIDLAE